MTAQRRGLITILALGGGVLQRSSLTACRVPGYHPCEICGAWSGFFRSLAIGPRVVSSEICYLSKCYLLKAPVEFRISAGAFSSLLLTSHSPGFESWPAVGLRS